MLTTKLPMAFFAFISLAFFSPNSIAVSESEQQEESFSQPVQELTGNVGDIPVFSHIYGADFMTEQERCNYLLKLDSMKNKEERDAFRQKHRQEIDMRRKEKGG